MANSDFVLLLGEPREGRRWVAILWVLEKAGVSQPILILSLLLGTPETGEIM